MKSKISTKKIKNNFYIFKIIISKIDKNVKLYKMILNLTVFFD